MHRFFQQVLQHALERRYWHQLGHHLFHQLRRILRQVVEQLLHLAPAQQAPRVHLHQVMQVRGHHGGGIHHGVARSLCHVLFGGLDPVRIQAEGRIARGHAIETYIRMPRVDGQPHARPCLAAAHRHPLEANAVAVRTQVQLVTHMHRRRQEADFLGKLAPYALDAHQQVATTVLVHQLDQLVAHLQAENVHRLHVFPGGITLARRDRLDLFGRLRSGAGGHRQPERHITQHGRQ